MKKPVGLMLPLLFFSCIRRTEEDSFNKGVGVPKATWAKPEVKVCWEKEVNASDNLITAKARAIVEKAITKEYNLRTNLSFVGWDICRNTASPDVRITDFGANASPANGGNAGGLGTIDIEEFNGKPAPSSRTPVKFNFISACDPFYETGPNFLETCITFISLHEFGHVAALKHEQANPDSTCSLYEEPLKTVNVDTKEIVVTKYDHDSIMNYCKRDKVFLNSIPADQIYLSAGDIEILKKLYPSR